MTGLFITFEGVEGCGKTTQARRLEDYLEKSGRSVYRTREPGGTPIGREIRKILLDPHHAKIAPETELLLYAADRAQHVREKILPALERDEIVISDRFYDSTAAYQGAGRSTLTSDQLEWLRQFCARDCTPALTLWLDIDVPTGLNRARGGGGGDRIEQEALEFHQRVRDGFAAIAEREAERVKRIDASGSEDEVEDRIRAEVDPLLRS